MYIFNLPFILFLFQITKKKKKTDRFSFSSQYQQWLKMINLFCRGDAVMSFLHQQVGKTSNAGGKNKKKNIKTGEKVPSVFLVILYREVWCV